MSQGIPSEKHLVKASDKEFQDILRDSSTFDMARICSMPKVRKRCEPFWQAKYRQLYGRVPKLYSNLSWSRNLLGTGVYGFGENIYGQLGLGNNKSQSIPQRISGRFHLNGKPVKITRVSAGLYHTVCIDEKGGVWSFGYNNKGQLGLGPDSEKVVNTPQRIDPDSFRIDDKSPRRIVRISAGNEYTVCLDDEMNVWTFGNNDFGQLGLGSTDELKSTPHRVSNIPKIIQISAGAFHTVCLDGKGNVWTFGLNDVGQLGLGKKGSFYLTPQPTPNLRGITQVSAGGAHTVCLDTIHRVWTFGLNGFGQLGLGHTDPVNIPQHIDPNVFRVGVGLQPLRIVRISAGSTHTVCLDENGNVWGFGDNNYGQLGLTDKEVVNTPRRINPGFFGVDEKPVRIVRISTGNKHTVCIDEKLNVWGFGRNDSGQLDRGLVDVENVRNPIPQLIENIRAIQVSAGGFYTMLIGF